MQLVRYEVRQSTAILTLERPEKRNALSRELIAALAKTVEHAASDPDARCVVLTGDGPAFCAGMDLDELRGTVENSDEAELVWDDAKALSSLFQRIYSLPKPTIAAVNGVAVAGGAGLVTVCDLALAVPTAKFGYPEVRRGLVAAMVLPHLLRHVGERAARKMLLTGELIDAMEAERIGLINAIVPPEDLLSTALQWAGQCAAGGPRALATTKTLLERCSKQAVSVDELADASAEPRLNEECRGGLKAFFAKEKAPWVPK
jgi:methylglutaconyl-CoA hydratase